MGKLSPFCALFQDEGAQVAGRSFELVFGEGQDEQGDSGHAAARCSMWPSQQVMRELPEGGEARVSEQRSAAHAFATSNET